MLTSNLDSDASLLCSLKYDENNNIRQCCSFCGFFQTDMVKLVRCENTVYSAMGETNPPQCHRLICPKCIRPEVSWSATCNADGTRQSRTLRKCPICVVFRCNKCRDKFHQTDYSDWPLGDGVDVWWCNSCWEKLPEAEMHVAANVWTRMGESKLSKGHKPRSDLRIPMSVMLKSKVFEEPEQEQDERNTDTEDDEDYAEEQNVKYNFSHARAPIIRRANGPREPMRGYRAVSADERAFLERAYQKSPYVDTCTKLRLAEALGDGWDVARLTSWFCNRRTTERKRKAAETRRLKAEREEAARRLLLNRPPLKA
jgi:hypothetical protein